MRAYLLLPLALLASSSSWGAPISEARRVRASLDEPAAAALPPSPRRIRSSLDEGAPPEQPLGSAGLFPLGDVSPGVVAPPTRRLFRTSLGAETAQLEGRLIRLSLDESGAVYGRLSIGPRLGRQVRSTLD